VFFKKRNMLNSNFKLKLSPQNTLNINKIIFKIHFIIIRNLHFLYRDLNVTLILFTFLTFIFNAVFTHVGVFQLPFSFFSQQAYFWLHLFY